MKKELIQKLIDAQQVNLDSVINRIKTLDIGANLDEWDTLDPTDYSQQNQYSEKSDYLSDEKIMLQNNLSQLKLALHRSNEKVSPGAVVVTEPYYFVIGPNFENITFEGKEVLPVSTFTKVYYDNKGKKKGEIFELIMADKSYEILDIM